jgi:hypothetical protein
MTTSEIKDLLKIMKKLILLNSKLERLKK